MPLEFVYALLYQRIPGPGTSRNFDIPLELERPERRLAVIAAANEQLPTRYL
jgi:hypothetical protein